MKHIVDEIFKLPNTAGNLALREHWIREYKEAHKIPAHHGVNVALVIKWVKDLKPQ